jgi:hypothetical protein
MFAGKRNQLGLNQSKVSMLVWKIRDIELELPPTHCLFSPQADLSHDGGKRNSYSIKHQ